MVDDARSQRPPTQPNIPGGRRRQSRCSHRHDAVGAYVLDALPEDERRAFEAHLATCLTCRQGVAELAPVVALLGRRYDAEPEPVADLRPVDRSARAHPGGGAGTTELAAAPIAAHRVGGPGRPGRDRCRHRRRPPRAPAQIVSLRRPRWIATGWPAAAVLALFATGAVFWGLTLQTRLNAREAACGPASR